MMVYITMVMVGDAWKIVNAFRSEAEALNDADELYTIEGFEQVKVHQIFVQ